VTAQAPTRKLAAILSADVVGYTLLMRADETTTIATLKRCHELMQSLIEQHGGRVVNTAGDGLLAEFASAVNAPWRCNGRSPSKMPISQTIERCNFGSA